MNELEQAMNELPGKWDRRDIEHTLGVTEHKARAIIRAWRADGLVQAVPGENYVYTWANTPEQQNARPADRQTDRQMHHTPQHSTLRATFAIGTLCLLFGLIGGYWGSALAAAPVSAPVHAQSTTVDGLRIIRATPFYWEPGQQAAGALETGTPYEPIARYRGSWIQIALINHDGTRTPVWVVSADIVYPHGLADLAPPPTPTTAPPPPQPVLVMQQPPVQVHVPPQLAEAAEQVQAVVAPTATLRPVATVPAHLVSSQADRTIRPPSGDIMGCGPDMNGEHACDRFVGEHAMPQTWRRVTIQDLEIDLNNP